MMTSLVVADNQKRKVRKGMKKSETLTKRMQKVTAKETMMERRLLVTTSIMKLEPRKTMKEMGNHIWLRFYQSYLS